MFFNLKKIKPVFHTLLLAFAGLEVLQFGASQLIIAIAHNYRVMTFFSIIVSACYIPVILFIPVKLWHRLTRPQRMFSTAIFIYSGLLFLGLILLAIWRENAISSVTYLNNISGVTAIVFFTIALGEQMRAVEVERNQILQEMNRLKNEQNTILEEVVEKRTLELREVNAVLVNQQEILSRRNERIELLLKELHHRVKNNLQLISSFYDLRRDDPAKKDMNVFLEEGKNRINVMSVVHNMLYHGNDSTTIDINSFIYMIASHLETLFNSNHLIEIRIVCADLNFDIDTAIPLGLIFNELVTNAYKHTQPDKSKILVQISIEQLTEHLFQLTITDNGKKIRKKIEPEKTQSFGIHMIFLLSKQLNGNFTYEYDGKNIFIVKFMDTEGRRQIP
jgi:two-component sensor histidine kinase